jgi:hypothetical protein
MMPDWWERFLGKTVRLPPGPGQERGCLIWVGAMSRGGQRTGKRAIYGSFWLNPGMNAVRTHVAAATVAGIITDFRVPVGMNLDHVCGRGLCVEEGCLELVTKLENQRRKAVVRQGLSPDQAEALRAAGQLARVGWFLGYRP